MKFIDAHVHVYERLSGFAPHICACIDKKER